MIGSKPAFGAAILREGLDALLTGELGVGKHMLRNYINGAIGFEALSKRVKIPVKSLMRMLGPKGNPQMTNLFAIVGALTAHARIELHVVDEKAAEVDRRLLGKARSRKA